MPDGLTMTLEVRARGGGPGRDAAVAFDRIEDGVERAAARALAVTGQVLVGRYQEKISTGQRSGRVYRRGKSGRHQASAPGELPKSDSGELVSHFAAKPVTIEAGGLGIEVINDAPHAVHVEYKDEGAGGRPFMRRIPLESEDLLATVYSNELAANLRREARDG